MSGVVDFAKAKQERSPHCRGTAFCMTCKHEWDAVWPAGTVDIECPACHSMRGRSKFDVVPAAGSAWTCMICDNQLFTLLQDRVHCPGCGKQWGYEELAQ